LLLKDSRNFGIIIFCQDYCIIGILVTYSPDDPNFIFPENTQIKNLLGFQGSFISDLFFQSIGLVSYLISFTILITGVNIFTSKDFFLLLKIFFL
jgi:S-DNA-T family DNA segregation ATPase FtsK/SpoIIIE